MKLQAWTALALCLTLAAARAAAAGPGCVSLATSAELIWLDLATEDDAYAISGDGSTVVGGPDLDYRWTREGGYQRITNDGNDEVYDGSLVVGDMGPAFTWTSAGGLTNLGALAGHNLPPRRVSRAMAPSWQACLGTAQSTGRWSSAGPARAGWSACSIPTVRPWSWTTKKA
jgi:hypothetical protein